MGDYLRPLYHLITEKGQWQNDPCGPYYSDGVYYLHHQFNPFETYWGNMHWGTFKSTDFVHWERAEDAIVPGYLSNPEGTITFDEFHAFSGSALAEGVDGKPTLFYTGITRDLSEVGLFWRNEYIWGTESQGLQYTNDDGEVVKVELIPTPDPSWNVTSFRDPFVWKNDDGSANMVVAGGLVDWDHEANEKRWLGGAVFLYKSDGDDLLTWTAQKEPFFFPQTEVSVSGIGDATFGGNIEVANVFTLSDRKGYHQYDFLTISCEFPAEVRLRAVKWVLGEVINDAEGNTKFDWHQWGFLDQGMMYAPTTILKEGDRTLFGWLDEPQATPTGPLALMGSSGVQGIPRHLFIQSRSIYSTFGTSDIWHLSWSKRSVQYLTLGQRPTPEIYELRGERLYNLGVRGSRFFYETVEVPSGVLTNAASFQLDVVAPYVEGGTVSFDVFANSEISTGLTYDFDSQTFTVSYANSSPYTGAYNNTDGTGVYVAECGLVNKWNFRKGEFETEDLIMQVFADRSTIEIFINERCVTSVRSYPSEDATEIRYTGSAEVRQLRVWEYTENILTN